MCADQTQTPGVWCVFCVLAAAARAQRERLHIPNVSLVRCGGGDGARAQRQRKVHIYNAFMIRRTIARRRRRPTRRRVQKALLHAPGTRLKRYDGQHNMEEFDGGMRGGGGARAERERKRARFNHARFFVVDVGVLVVGDVYTAA